MEKSRDEGSNREKASSPAIVCVCVCVCARACVRVFVVYICVRTAKRHDLSREIVELVVVFVLRKEPAVNVEVRVRPKQLFIRMQKWRENRDPVPYP